MLDEFHTYDGAQGTDVAMLLRRLGLALKSHWPDDDAAITAEDRTARWAELTPVATSATLGDKGDPAAMLEFAQTVFGEPFDDDARGHRVPAAASTSGRPAAAEKARRGHEPVAIEADRRRGRKRGGRRARRAPTLDPEALTRTVLTTSTTSASPSTRRCCSTCSGPTRWSLRWPARPPTPSASATWSAVLGPAATPQLAATGADRRLGTLPVARRRCSQPRPGRRRPGRARRSRRTCGCAS